MKKSKEIKKQLKQYFSLWLPANIILTDPGYDSVSADDLRSEIIYIPADGDCDDATRELWCHFRHLHPQWPVGICLLNKIAGQKTNHAMLVCICNDGVYLVEPQAIFSIGLEGMTKMWLANKKKDRFYFVYI